MKNKARRFHPRRLLRQCLQAPRSCRQTKQGVEWMERPSRNIFAPKRRSQIRPLSWKAPIHLPFIVFKSQTCGHPLLERYVHAMPPPLQCVNQNARALLAAPCIISKSGCKFSSSARISSRRQNSASSGASRRYWHKRASLRTVPASAPKSSTFIKGQCDAGGNVVECRVSLSTIPVPGLSSNRFHNSRSL